MYTLIFCRFHACFPEDIIGSGNTYAVFHWMGIYMQPRLSSLHKAADPVHIFYISHLFIYMVYMFTCNTVYMITYILLIYLDCVYCSCVIILRTHDYMITCLHVHMYTLNPHLYAQQPLIRVLNPGTYVNHQVIL